MRYLVILLTILSTSSSVMAAEAGKVNSIVKGTKSYQARTIGDDAAAAAAVAPAAGAEESSADEVSDKAAMATPQEDSTYSKPVMKLHGKK